MVNHKNTILARHGHKILLALLFLGVYVIGAYVQGFYVNTDMNKGDQEDYLSRAIQLKADLNKPMSDGNRMPVYPYLLSFLYTPGMSMQEYFQRGKIFNISLSVILLFVLYPIFRWCLHGPEAKLLLLIIAFTVFMPRAGYVQCELPFYFLTFCAFISYWGFLKKPRWWLAASAGVFAGLGYLTKASALPAVVWFVACFFIFHIAVPAMKNIMKGIDNKFKAPPKQVLRNTIYLAAFVAIFLTTVRPYINVNHKMFGHYFYNVNSTFYIWYDSWDDVVKGTRAHGDRVGWPTMPAEDIPTATKYWQDHTLSQVLGRFAHGFIVVTTNALGGFGYAQYFCIYFIICILAVIKQPEAFVEYIKRDNNYVVVISLVFYFLMYFLLYVFGAAIFKGPRHPLAQYLPAMFAMFYFLSKFGFSHYSQKIGCRFNLREIHIVVFCLLVLDLIFHMPYKLYQVYAGW
jgi:hypothetical protein